MQIQDNTAFVNTANDLLSEITSSAQPEVEMMIGIGIVKDSEAVFFQYLGDDRAPMALMLPSGKPVTRMEGVLVTGISIAEGVGEFNSTKLNLFLQTGNGRTIMLTSGLSTLWSQCVLTGLNELAMSGGLENTIALDSWKGNSKMRPCFAAVRQGRAKFSSQEMYDALVSARQSKNFSLVEEICRDAVAVISGALSTPITQDVVVLPSNDSSDY